MKVSERGPDWNIVPFSVFFTPPLSLEFTLSDSFNFSILVLISASLSVVSAPLTYEIVTAYACLY